MKSFVLSLSMVVLTLVFSTASVFAALLCPIDPGPTCDPTDPLDRAPSSGAGTVADPYVITDCCELQGIADSTGKYNVLGNDIECAASAGWNAGAGFIPIGGNGGLIYNGGGLDGKGFAINDLFMDDAVYTGLFARASDVTIENLNLVDADVNGTTIVGGVVANAFNGTSLTEVSVSGSVSGTQGTVGGIVGQAVGSFTLADCSSSADVSGTNSVGGLVGVATNTDGINNCHADATVTATSHTVGGAVGNYGGNISPSALSNTCAEGSVNSSSTFRIGGLVGYLTPGGSIVDSYWDNNQLMCVGLDLGAGTTCTEGCPPPPPSCDPTDSADRAPSSGAGTSGDPYVIADCCQLQGIADSNGEYYVLGNDIECAATAGWNGGDGFIPIGGHGGLIYNGGGLDGQGYAINDLFMDDAVYTGLFARAAGVTIENLNLVNADVNGTFIVGGVVGNAYNGTSLTDVTAENSSVSGTSSNVGGLVGSAGTGVSFEDCSYTGDVSGTAVVGGLVGVATNTAGITNCHTDADITATSHSVGGLVGNFGGAGSSPISESCAFGDVDTGIKTFRVGGLVGYLNGGGSIVDSGYENSQPMCVGQDLGAGTTCASSCPLCEE